MKSAKPRRNRRTAVGVAFALVGVAVTGAGVYAALSATAFNTSAQSVTSGTLKLVLADNGNGFSTGILLLAPGDVVNRYVDLTNSGTLDGKNITFKAVDSVPRCSAPTRPRVCTSRSRPVRPAGRVDRRVHERRHGHHAGQQRGTVSLGSAATIISGAFSASSVHHPAGWR